MPFGPAYKLQAYDALVEMASNLAKQDGFAATPLRRFTASIGRTTGAFYTQFDSRDDLLHAIVDHEMQRTLRHFIPMLADSAQGEGASSRHNDLHAALFDALDAYLHASHAQDWAGGCVLPALAAEIGRARPSTRRTCEKGLLRLHAYIEEVLGAPDVAWAVMSQAVGAVLLARAMASSESRKEVLTSTATQLRAHHVRD